MESTVRWMTASRLLYVREQFVEIDGIASIQYHLYTPYILSSNLFLPLLLSLTLPLTISPLMRNRSLCGHSLCLGNNTPSFQN